MRDWLYYRIYAKPKGNQDWYHDLLKEVVRPFVSENEKLIDSFFFFHYHHPYGQQPWNSIEASEPKFKQGDDVYFIRLRVLAKQKDLKALEDSLIKFMDKSPTVFQREKCAYNEKGDLGNRFGETRRELVRKYLEYASRITLSLLDEPKDQKYYEKLDGLIHLPSNMLEYIFKVKCPNCQRELQVRL